ncbi:hypothetical protein GCM10022419_115260 [Nonomuraea rosea]|uniref:Integral membrane protein n=1 Tax=Nonomuraea rosea TaxID=638574 RepID=A0ABP6ZJD6_9ACTN
MDDALNDALDDEARVDYTGAVYGSLLAASVVAGTSPAKDPPAGFVLSVLIVATGLVFWLAHVYARLVGERRKRELLTWRQVRRVGTHERPLAEAALPPALAAMAGWAVGLPPGATAWLALVTALAGQVVWAAVAGAKAGIGTRLVVFAAVGNLLIGSIIVALKVALAH